MNTLRPVRPTYVPGYPRELDEAEIRDLLRPGLVERYSTRTLLAGGIVIGATLAAHGEPLPASPLPMAGHSTRTDPDLRTKVEAIVHEVLGRYESGAWYSNASINLVARVPGNPPLKTPAIPIMFGNSFNGIFDTERAKNATRDLFAAFGIELKPDVKVRNPRYTFTADGYNTELNVGFELPMPERTPTLNNTYYGVNERPAAKLDKDERAALGDDIVDGKLRMFVADPYSLYDGDQQTPMRFYLASVIDYLNWIHGDKEMELNTVLGEHPPGLQSRSWNDPRPALPGCDFESESDLQYWAVTDGTMERSGRWSSHGTHSLRLVLNPGGTAIYTPPQDTEITFGQAGTLSMNLLNAQFDDEQPVYVPIEVTVEVTGGSTWANTQILRPSTGPGSNLRMEWKYTSADTPGPVQRIAISTDSSRPVLLFIDDLGVKIDTLE